MNNAFIIGRYLIFQADKRASVVVSSLFLFNLEESIEKSSCEAEGRNLQKNEMEFYYFFFAS